MRILILSADFFWKFLIELRINIVIKIPKYTHKCTKYIKIHKVPDTFPRFHPNFKFLDTFRQNKPSSGRRLGSYVGECTVKGVAGSRQWVALQ